MKAVFIIPNLAPGGIQTQVFYLAKYFQNELGFEVVIYGLNTKQKEFVRLLESESLNYKFRPNIGALIENYNAFNLFKKIYVWFRLWTFLLSLGSTILLPYTKPIDIFINSLWRLTRIKLSFSFERGGHANPTPLRLTFVSWFRKISKPIYVSNSNHGKRAIHIVKGVSLSEIHVIKNAYIPTHTINKNGFLDKIESFKGDELLVVMVANYFPEKEHLLVIEAWQKIKSKSGVKLVLAGLGGAEICKQNAALAQRRITTLGLQDEIVTLGSIDNVSSLLKLADIGLLASKSEGCPNAILEYMGMGLPVVASNIPGIKEILPEANHKFLFNNDHVGELVSKLTRLLSNEELRKQLGEENKKFVLKEFNAKNVYSKYDAILKVKRILD